MKCRNCPNPLPKKHNRNGTLKQFCSLQCYLSSCGIDDGVRSADPRINSTLKKQVCKMWSKEFSFVILFRELSNDLKYCLELYQVAKHKCFGETSTTSFYQELEIK